MRGIKNSKLVQNALWKRIGYSLLGLLFPIVWFSLTLITLVFFKIQEILALSIILTILVLQVLALHYFSKNKILKTANVIGTTTFTLFLIYTLVIPKLPFFKKEEVRIPVVKTPKKLTQLLSSLESDVSDSFAIHVSIDSIGIQEQNPYKVTVEGFKPILNHFKLDTSKTWNKRITPTPFEIKNNQLFTFVTKDGRVIDKILTPPNGSSDSTIYIGYLSDLNLFVFVENLSEYGPNYTCLHSITGQWIEGIPLYANKTNEFYSSVLFETYIGDLNCVIQLWHREQDAYTLIYQDAIYLSGNFNDARLFRISNAFWDKKDFKFNLHFNDESATIKLKVLD